MLMQKPPKLEASDSNQDWIEFIYILFLLFLSPSLFSSFKPPFLSFFLFLFYFLHSHFFFFLFIFQQGLHVKKLKLKIKKIKGTQEWIFNKLFTVWNNRIFLKPVITTKCVYCKETQKFIVTCGYKYVLLLYGDQKIVYIATTLSLILNELNNYFTWSKKWCLNKYCNKYLPQVLHDNSCRIWICAIIL